MQLKTILNRVTDYKSFVFGKTTWLEGRSRLAVEVEVAPRANGRPLCSGCGRAGPTYDRAAQPRRFEFVPLWGITVYFVYCMRRVNCRGCGVKVERVPWAEGKSPTTIEYQWYLARWAKRMSWKEVAEAFCVSWDRVYEAVKHAVSWGLAHRDLSGIEAIGVDEVQWHRGHQYQTVVYQLDEGRKRLLWIGPDRTAKTLLRFFRWLGKKRTAELQFISSDMWQAYLKVIAKKAGHALHVLDRFHIMQRMNKAIDQVRAAEVKQLKADGYEPVLKNSRWLLLKRPENLSDRQAAKLAELLQYNLKSIRSHLMKEDFQRPLGILEPRLGRQILGSVVYSRDALEDRPHEENGQDASRETRADPQLVPRRRKAFRRYRRGVQQQAETDHQKVVWLSHPRSI